MALPGEQERQRYAIGHQPKGHGDQGGPYRKRDEEWTKEVSERHQPLMPPRSMPDRFETTDEPGRHRASCEPGSQRGRRGIVGSQEPGQIEPAAREDRHPVQIEDERERQAEQRVESNQWRESDADSKRKRGGGSFW